MAFRDRLRYIVAIVVGIAMWLSNDSPWTGIGIGVILVAVVAWSWHSRLASNED